MMIIRSKAPMRLGLAGGGSDVSPYSDLYGGIVLNATINLYTHCSIEETGDGMITIDAYDSDYHASFPMGDPLPLEGSGLLVKGVYNRLTRDFGLIPRSFHITTYNEAPSGSGLGSSSSMVVCIIKAFMEWYSLPLGDYELARLAYEIERIDLKLSGGKQDQYAASFGGFNFIEFLPNDMVIVNPLKIKRWIIDELEDSIVLYYTGKSRMGDSIINEQKKNTISGNTVAIEAMHRIKQNAIDMKEAIIAGNISSLAKIIEEGWESKKKMASSISNPMIQKAFDTAMAAGARAGRVSGAGGGGFMMIITDPVNKLSVINALKQLGGFVLPFQFSSGGPHGWKISEEDKA